MRTVNGIDIFEPATIAEIRTGTDPNGSTEDVQLTFRDDYFRTLWFDPDPSTRTALIPSGNVTDAMSVMMHELGHALGFNGWRDYSTGQLPGNYESTYDQFVSFSGGYKYFTGSNAVAIYGGPVPLFQSILYHLGNPGGPGANLSRDLMTGFDYSGRYFITPLDLAILKDTGAPIASANPPIRMFRAYNPTADYHFFTTSRVEFDNAVTHGYRDETTGKPGFDVLPDATAGASPIFRLYNKQTGRHYYTTSAAERDYLVSLVPASNPTAGWRYEKDEGFIYAAPTTGTTEVFRLYNKNSGVHLYTESVSTKNAILAQFPGVWVQHTSLGFAFAVAAASVAQESTAGASASLAAASAGSAPSIQCVTPITSEEASAHPGEPIRGIGFIGTGVYSATPTMGAPVFPQNASNPDDRPRTRPMSFDRADTMAIDDWFVGDGDPLLILAQKLADG